MDGGCIMTEYDWLYAPSTSFFPCFLCSRVTCTRVPMYNSIAQYSNNKESGLVGRPVRRAIEYGAGKASRERRHMEHCPCFRRLLRAWVD